MLDALAGVAQQIEADRNLEVALLTERDRALRAELARYRNRPAHQLRAWMRKVDGKGAATAEQVHGARWSIGVSLSIVGLCMGFVAAVAVFHYDGTQPVNVTWALGLFVAVQAALLLLMAFALIPRRWILWAPPVAALERLLHRVNLGLLWRVASRVLPPTSRDALAGAMLSSLRHERIHGEVYQWQLLRWSQVVALSFQLGVAGTFAIKVVGLQDIAFAWSTQAEFVARNIPRIVDVLSSLWAQWWPEARPSVEFVEATRYSRLRGGEFASSPKPDATALGQWWPFLMACLITYGVMPRFLTWAYTAHRSRRAAEWSLARLPGVDLVLHRLNEIDVHTGAATAAGSQSVREAAPHATTAPTLPQTPQAFVNWASAPDDELLFPVTMRVDMGGSNTPANDEEAVAAVAEAIKGGVARGVVIGVRAWEAPTESLFDVARALRQALDAGPVITLYPLNIEGEADRSIQWATHAATLGDPWLRVACAPRRSRTSQ